MKGYRLKRGAEIENLISLLVSKNGVVKADELVSPTHGAAVSEVLDLIPRSANVSVTSDSGHLVIDDFGEHATLFVPALDGLPQWVTQMIDPMDLEVDPGTRDARRRVLETLGAALVGSDVRLLNYGQDYHAVTAEAKAVFNSASVVFKVSHVALEKLADKYQCLPPMLLYHELWTSMVPYSSVIVSGACLHLGIERESLTITQESLPEELPGEALPRNIHFLNLDRRLTPLASLVMFGVPPEQLPALFPKGSSVVDVIDLSNVVGSGKLYVLKGSECLGQPEAVEYWATRSIIYGNENRSAVLVMYMPGASTSACSNQLPNYLQQWTLAGA